MELFDKDELFDKVWDYVQKRGFASIADIQRNFTLGYARAARIVNQLESEGFIYYDEKGNRKLNLNPQKIIEQKKEIVIEGFENFSAPITLFLKALRHGVLKGKISTSDIQIVSSVGYSRAILFLDKMLELGFIEPPSKRNLKYNVVLTVEEYNRRFKELDEIN